MSTPNEGDGRPRPDSTRAGEQVRRLIEEAGPPPDLPAEHLAGIKEAVRRDWRASIEEARPRTSAAGVGWWLAAAAALVAVAAGWWWLARPADSVPSTVAVRRLVGGAEAGSVEPGAPGAEKLRAGVAIPLGWRVSTAAAGGDSPGRVALRLPGGGDVRLDHDTRVVLVAAARIELEAGAVYVDSGAGPDNEQSLEIATPFGVVRDVGTRFEVRFLERDEVSVRVRVRDGLVSVAAVGASRTVAPGGQITVAQDGSVTESQATTSGADWAWMMELAQPFDPDGRTVVEVLDWISRETGWRILFDDSTTAAEARVTVVHGTFEDVRPDRAPELVLPSAGLTGELDGDVLIVRNLGS